MSAEGLLDVQDIQIEYSLFKKKIEKKNKTEKKMHYEPNRRH